VVDNHTVVVQEHLKQNKTINANANLMNATNALVGALAGFNMFETVQDGELVSA